MIVYTTGEKSAKQPSFIMSLSPANDPPGAECPADWVDDKNNPVQINVEFQYGRADVPDDLGRYMIKRGFAAKTKLILPAGLLTA